MRKSILLALVVISMPRAGLAQEVFGGVLRHGVNTPFSFDTGESGTDYQLGYRTDRMRVLAPIGAPHMHVFGSVNDRGDTSFAAAGLDWVIGKGPVFVRPGIGIALHDGPAYRVSGSYRIDLGSRVLFEPEFGVGIRLAPRIKLEAEWTHISHAKLFGGQNPGLDMMGARLSFALGR